ncbi:MAG: ubiquinol-cytochrome c reductase iron-sulfur subunit [Actinobacteria bacterium]|nr:ubiquinol-cytochrome c reductase iron-sulfur subunit [Actinomycetota bacterium]
MSKLKDALIAGLVLLAGKRRKDPYANLPEQRIVEEGAPDRRAENVVLVLFAVVVICAVAFIVVYSFESLAHQTQYLGLAIGLAFVVLAAACIVIATRLIVTEELEEPYPDLEHPDESDAVAEIVEESGSRFTRKRLVRMAGLGAVGTLGAALITPALSLGPAFNTDKLKWTPWRRGRRLVDDAGKPLLASEIEEESFYSAYPEGADRELMGSPIIVVRVPLDELKTRHDWAPHGIVAFSKICTHAGCAVTLYRKPTFAPTQPRPALVCPCHYSTFDPAEGGKVIFGPAGRNLPQLPLTVDGKGYLRAAGTFNEPIGPSWWGVRRGRSVS